MIVNGRSVKVGADFTYTPEEAVLYTEQNLTPEQQAQVRDNIGVSDPIQKIDNTNSEEITVLHDLESDSYVLNGFFPYNGNSDEEGIQFSNDLVIVEKYEVENSTVVQFLRGRYLHSVAITSDYVDYKEFPLINDDPSPEPEAQDHSVYFEIDVDGLISLKPEYRGDSTDYYVNTGKYTFSESDRGIGYEGSKISELPERLVIPDNVNGEMVTGFQKAIFCCNKKIKEVVLPSSVKAISNGMFREAIHLEKVENTEQIETIGTAAFSHTRIEEIRFPNLATLGNQVFYNCSCLRLIDIGKITAIGSSVFFLCENLSTVIGGENVKTIGNFAFHATRRLKKLSFLSNVTKISGGAFFSSRCDFEDVYPTMSDDVFEGTATYKQFNTTDYWSEVLQNKQYTACKNPLNTVFHQLDPRWANKQIGNLFDEEEQPLTYGYNGCALIVLAEIYSAFEKVHFDSPEEFTQILESKGLLLDYRYPAGWMAMAEGLGYTVEFIDTMTKENLIKIYDALAEGALVDRSIGVIKDGAIQVTGGHAILAYGVNSDGELLTANSSPRCYELGIYENHKAAWHIYQHGSEICNAVIVKKSNAQ